MCDLCMCESECDWIEFSFLEYFSYSKAMNHVSRAERLSAMIDIVY